MCTAEREEREERDLGAGAAVVAEEVGARLRKWAGLDAG